MLRRYTPLLRTTGLILLLAVLLAGGLGAARAAAPLSPRGAAWLGRPPEAQAASSELWLAPPATPIVDPPEKDDALVGDVDGDGRADPGDTLRYTVTFTNRGDQPAQALLFSDTLDPNLTLVGGSLRVSPVAVNDAYSTYGNTLLSVPAAQGVLLNDLDPDDPLPNPPLNNGLSVTAYDTISFQGGTVVMNADGSFS